MSSSFDGIHRPTAFDAIREITDVSAALTGFVGGLPWPPFRKYAFLLRANAHFRHEIESELHRCEID